jgi:AcrR family transcriptional regulator
MRVDLIETAARLIAEDGLAALSLRRLAREVGTSTMAIYTHFGSMDEVRRAVRREGFARLAAHLSDVAETADPVVDLALLGAAYYTNATSNPNLYRAMFMDRPVDDDDAGVGIETFNRLVAGVDRCIRAGRFADADAVAVATEFWSLIHGIVTLQLAGLLSSEQAIATFAEAGRKLIVASGDDPQAADQSIDTARRRSRVADSDSSLTRAR